MINAILATKLGSKQVFDEKGDRKVVTVVKTGPLSIVGVRTPEKDGYTAVQLGMGLRRTNVIKKPVLGLMKKAGLSDKLPRFVREVEGEVKEGEELKIGAEVTASFVFKVGDKVVVTGTSKGKGFQGGVKRHGFRGGPRTHGQSDRERAPGSIGQTTTPGRVYKGKRMAGRMGNDRVSVKNLEVVSIDDAAHTMCVTGVLPGGKNGLLIIKKIN